MSFGDDNLFVAAGCATNEAPGAHNTAGTERAAEEPETPAAPPHPAQHLQDAYLECISVHATLSEVIRAAEAVGNRVGYSCDIRDSRISVESMSKCAVRKTVDEFEKTLRERADLDPEEEFTRAFGKPMYELIEEGHGERWERERHESRFQRIRKARRGGVEYEPEEDDEQMPPPYQLDLLKLWDSLAATYSDGGLTLARQQAARQLLRSWSLERQQFEVKNGKAVIVDRVWSEKKGYGFHAGERTVGYNYTQDVYKLFKALEVFLSFCDIEYYHTTTLRQMSDGSDIIVRSGAKYAICAGMEVRTFSEEWKYTLSAGMAEKLREFIATYGVTAEE